MSDQREEIRKTIEHAPHGQAGAHPPAEEDRIQSGTIVFVGVGALVVFFAASLLVISSAKHQQRELLPQGPAPLPAELGSPKIGLLEQRMFENSNQAQSWREGQQRKLGSYGWVDPAQGIVRLPIDRAMELVIEGARPEASPPPRGGAADLGRPETGGRL